MFICVHAHFGHYKLLYVRVCLMHNVCFPLCTSMSIMCVYARHVLWTCARRVWCIAVASEGMSLNVYMCWLCVWSVYVLCVCVCVCVCGMDSFVMCHSASLCVAEALGTRPKNVKEFVDFGKSCDTPKPQGRETGQSWEHTQCEFPGHTMPHSSEHSGYMHAVESRRMR